MRTLACSLCLCLLICGIPRAQALEFKVHWHNALTGKASKEELSLLRLALRAVAQSRRARATNEKIEIFVTNSKGSLVKQLQKGRKIAATYLDAPTFSFAHRLDGKNQQSVVILWDRIMRSPYPLSTLVVAVARETLGQMNTVPKGDPFTPATLEEEILVSKTAISFLRELPALKVYQNFDPTVKLALTEALDASKSNLREFRMVGKNTGLCDDLLDSEDN